MFSFRTSERTTKTPQWGSFFGFQSAPSAGCITHHHGYESTDVALFHDEVEDFDYRADPPLHPVLSSLGLLLFFLERGILRRKTHVVRTFWLLLWSDTETQITVRRKSVTHSCHIVDCVKSNCMLLYIQCGGFKDIETDGAVDSSPGPSLGWPILYWGVEYKSRPTGPLSVVRKSKDVPFEVGAACGLSSQITEKVLRKRFFMGSHHCTASCPTHANRYNCCSVIKWLTNKVF